MHRSNVITLKEEYIINIVIHNRITTISEKGVFIASKAYFISCSVKGSRTVYCLYEFDNSFIESVFFDISLSFK